MQAMREGIALDTLPILAIIIPTTVYPAKAMTEESKSVEADRKALGID